MKKRVNISDKIDIRPDHFKMVQDILNKHLSSDVKVWVYGSRAKWTTLDSSDLDLALEGKDQIDDKVMHRLSCDFEDSNLPYEVDVVDMATAQPFFRDIINKDKVLLDRYALVKAKKVIPEGWQEVDLKKCVIINDSTYSNKDAWAFINYLDTGSITNNRVTEIQHLVVGKDKVPSRAKKKALKNDIIYSTVRPNQRHFGLLKRIPKNFLVSTGFCVIRGKNKVAYTDFIYWFLSQDHIIKHLQAIAEQSTSAYPSIKPSDLEKLKMTLPSYAEQCAIANILGSLDDKIEQNQNINKILEGIAQAIFKSWFIDFDPVHAKAMALKAGLSKKQAERGAMAVIAGVCSPKQFAENFKQMDLKLSERLSQMNQSKQDELAYTASLFPSEFIDSKLSLIPKGWSCKTINKIADVIGGGTPSTKNKDYYCSNEEGFPWLTPKDLSGYSWKYISEGVKNITDSGLKKSSAKMLPTEAVVISSRAPIGYIAIAENKLSTNQGFKSLVPKNHIDTQILYYWAKSNINKMKAVATGSTFQEITGTSMKNLKIIVSDIVIREQFNNLITASSKSQRIIRHENNILTKIRDALLPKLLSGEIDVSKIKIKEKL